MARRPFASAAGLAVLLSLLPGLAAAACSAPPAGSDLKALETALQACYPKTDAPAVEMLNLIQRYPNDPASVSAALWDYIQAHDADLAHYQKNGGAYVENVHNGKIDPRAADRQTLALISGRMYDAYMKEMGRPHDLGDAAASGKNPAPEAAPEHAGAAPARTATPSGDAVETGILARLDPQGKIPQVTERRARLAAKDGDLKAAASLYASLQEDGKPTLAGLVGLGGVAYAQGDYARSRRLAAEALKKAPDDRKALALYHMSDGRVPDENPAAALKAAAADRDARTALRLGDPAEAERRAGEALRLDPDDEAALSLRAAARARRNDWGPAAEDAGRALALKPDDAAALQTRAWAYGRLGRWAEAERDADALVALAPVSAYAHYARAFALSGLGRRADALAELRRAADLDPSFRDRYEKAVQLPQDADMALLFDPGAAAPGARPAAPAPAGRRLPRGVAAAGAGLVALLGVVVLLPKRRRAA